MKSTNKILMAILIIVIALLMNILLIQMESISGMFLVSFIMN